MRTKRKNLALDQCEIKFASSRVASEPTRFTGYASMFNGLDSYGDIILPGAYAKTLKERRNPVLLLRGHNPSRIIGKPIKLIEDSKGLLLEGELAPGVQDANEVDALMRHGSISGLSIGYSVPAGGEVENADGTRTLKQIDLVEISVVGFPADDAARIDLSSVKEQLDQIESITELEDFLREEGSLSRSAAKAVISRSRAVLLRDAGTESELVTRLKAELSRRDAVIAELQAQKLCAEFRLPT